MQTSIFFEGFIISEASPLSLANGGSGGQSPLAREGGIIASLEVLLELGKLKLFNQIYSYVPILVLKTLVLHYFTVKALILV